MQNAFKVFFTAFLLFVGLTASAQLLDRQGGALTHQHSFDLQGPGDLGGQMNVGGQMIIGGQVLDTVTPKNLKDTTKKAADTAKKKEKKPQAKAAIRSAIIPGWGQAYNKKYWKIPIVYGALAIPVITFNYNKTWYNKTREAYTIRYNEDTARYDEIDPRLQPLSTGSLKIYRDEFRKNMDLSVLVFLAIWGLQVADAAVDAHLKGFNVTDDLSMKVKPWFSPTTKANGISLVFSFRDGRTRTVLPSY